MRYGKGVRMWTGSFSGSYVPKHVSMRYDPESDENTIVKTPIKKNKKNKKKKKHTACTLVVHNRGGAVKTSVNRATADTGILDKQRIALKKPTKNGSTINGTSDYKKKFIIIHKAAFIEIKAKDIVKLKDSNGECFLLPPIRNSSPLIGKRVKDVLSTEDEIIDKGTAPKAAYMLYVDIIKRHGLPLVIDEIRSFRSRILHKK